MSRDMEKALLDEISRATDLRAEERQHLEYELETSATARRAFADELLRLRALRDAAARLRRRLPPSVQAKLAHAQRARNFAQLVDLARESDAIDVAPPAFELVGPG